MRFAPSALAFVFALAAALPVAGQARAGGAAAGPAMTLTVAGFADGGTIPVRLTQAAPGVTAGGGTSPAIGWASAPEGTRSFLLHMHDMDVARAGTTDDQVHWVVWNIPAASSGLPEGVPAGSRLADGSFQISASGPMYRGPGAPANGPPHHYVFELYALDATLDVQPTEDAFATRQAVIAAAQGHVLRKAVYMGLFRRPE